MKKYDVIGLMSGTSLDGLDIAHVEFIQNTKWKFTIIHSQAEMYHDDLRAKLKHASKLSGLELKKLDIHYGKWIGNTVKQFMKYHRLKPDLIVSHGHTIFHQPEIGLTHQIGDGYQIMNITGLPTICDLRSMDVVKGGQGAPLVAIGDNYLFNEYDICLNLGGFSNISFEQNGKRIAYDICPVNTVLNYLASKIDLDYDKNGIFARSGIMNTDLFKKLNTQKYYDLQPPKSLGIEWVNKHIFSIMKGDSIENLLNTYCHHVAHQIASSIEHNINFKNFKTRQKLLVTGGGSKNSYLLELLKKEANENLDIILPDNQLIDFKEAVIFAFLGMLRWLGKINSLKSVTGADTNSSGGLIYDHFKAMNNPAGSII